MVLKEFIDLLESIFPPDFAFKGDGSGLQIGDINAKTTKVLLSLECTTDTIKFAIKNNFDLVLTHHPLLYNKINSITSKTSQGRTIMQAISKNIAIYSLHTNIDSIKNGLNDYLADLLDLIPIQPIELNESINLVKLVTFIPETHIEEIRIKLLDSGIGHIGNYSHCSFNTTGTGTYRPLDESNPFKGSKGRLETAREIRFETILFNKDVSRTISLLKSIHPYEEVAYDIYPLLNTDGLPGIGRICKPRAPISFFEIMELLPKKLDINFIRYNGPQNKKLQKIAICTGSGGSLIHKLREIDLFLTADLSYHQAMDAIERNIAFIDIGHDQEKIFIDLVYNIISKQNLKLIIEKYKNTVNPFLVKTYNKRKGNLENIQPPTD